MTSGPISLQDALEAIREILGPGRQAEELDADSQLVDLGLDSLDAAEIFLLLEEKAGEPLDPASAGELQRVEDLTKLRAAESAN
jgi:acyl carrier protein